MWRDDWNKPTLNPCPKRHGLSHELQTVETSRGSRVVCAYCHRPGDDLIREARR